MADTWEEAEKRLAQLAAEEPDWDGDGALAMLPGILPTCLKLFAKLKSEGKMPPTSLLLHSDGTLLVDWRMTRGFYEDFEIEVPGKVEWMIQRNGCSTEFRDELIELEPHELEGL